MHIFTIHPQMAGVAKKRVNFGPWC